MSSSPAELRAADDSAADNTLTTLLFQDDPRPQEAKVQLN